MAGFWTVVCCYCFSKHSVLVLVVVLVGALVIPMLLAPCAIDIDIITVVHMCYVLQVGTTGVIAVYSFHINNTFNLSFVLCTANAERCH